MEVAVSYKLLIVPLMQDIWDLITPSAQTALGLFTFKVDKPVLCCNVAG